MPSEYKGLRLIVDECKKQRIFNEEMLNIFDSELVRGRLGSMMDLTIKALEWISKYYEQRRHSENSPK